MLQQQKAKRGFTIIEVVLVLAIAGLIFLMVFLALPNLQRSQRDTQRRDDLARLQTAITNYQSNNRGKLPGTDSKDAKSALSAYEGFIGNYLRVNNDTFDDPDGNQYTIGSVCVNYTGSGSGECEDKTQNSSLNTFEANEHHIYIYQNATCDGEKVVKSTGTRKVAFLYKLEGGGWYCGNN